MAWIFQLTQHFNHSCFFFPSHALSGCPLAIHSLGFILQFVLVNYKFRVSPFVVVAVSLVGNYQIF